MPTSITEVARWVWLPGSATSEPAAGTRGDRYELRIPDRWLRTAYRTGWIPGAVPVPHPVFRSRGRLGGGLGLAAGSVYSALTGTPQPARQLGVAARVTEVRWLLARLVERALLDEARNNRVEAVVGFVAGSSDYAPLLRQTRWHLANPAAFLVTVEGVRGGAMVEAPRRLGLAFTAFWQRAPGGYPPGTRVPPLR